MANQETFGRFSSCRGVSFEIKPHLDPFAIPTRVMNEPPRGSKRFWLPWGSSSKIVPSSAMLERTMSRASSHFCDLDLDDDEDDDDALRAIEEGHYEEEELKAIPLPLPPAKSKREQPPKPTKPKESRLSVILLDQGLFTVYKRLFVVCLALNITGLVLAAIGHFPYARNRAALFSIGNILALTLCRSEACLRVVFWLAVSVLGWSWVPLRLKTATTSLLQCLGGIHSGCGVSSVAWLVYALVLTLKDRDNTSPEIIAVASAILSLLSLSCLAAFPLVRHLHHNIFERTHRFAGWTSLGLLWAFIILTISYDPRTKSYSNELGSRLIKQQEFWLTVAITLLIIIPWLTVRRVPVKVSAPSGHASIIKFEGGVKSGILGRISPSPLSEWHAFGIISDGKQEHMMLAGAVGDFTKSLVSNPPSHLWVRQVHFAGLPYLTNMYDRVLLVATGSGICVFLSFLLQPCSADVCVLWVAKGIEQNFGKEIKEMMSGHPKEKVIVHDTAVLGRPNVSQMSVDAAKRWGAQVVIVTSNPEGSRDVVNSCKTAGIAAFGPIWDS
ncbi:adenylate-forming reductase 03009-like isoform X1 [Cornus florida]|uniref:adenylate-forming reductase 03009-like isoform X1 n=1 Tax=Cornus florida TaxID=4283 RepID=UPI00289EFB4F|nr:adenylate-forming reductase 03009-like isoform X1 [Cornus florida]